MFPPLWGVTFAPPNRPTLDPYDGGWVALPPPTHDYGGEGVPRPRIPESRLRHLEVSMGGFIAPQEAVFSRTMSLRLFLAQFVLSGSWDRMYETPGDGSLARLDFYRFHLSSNMLGGAAKYVEIYPQMGAALMHGTQSTWAFDAGLEARIYPYRPLALMLSSIASIFGEGPVLFDTRAELGVSFDRFELRGGLRWLYQHQAQGFAGPVASVVVRL